MLQEFFTNNLQNTLIKNIVQSHPLPNIRTVRDGDVIVEGLNYIYKSYPILCTRTGILRDSKTLSDLFMDDTLSNTSATYKQADVQIQDYNYKLGMHKTNLTKKHVCKNSYYDQQTHALLGEYLRCLRDIYDINLMHLYNCFNYQLTDDLYFTEDNGIVYDDNDKEKVILIPIKFNKTYTIAIDCPSKMYIRPVLYNHLGVLSNIEQKYNDCGFTVEQYYKYQQSEDKQQIEENKIPVFNLQIKNFQRFQYPFKYAVNTVEKGLLQYEKFLYLVIQVPKSNRSSIVVLEGDYTKYNVRKLQSLDISLPHEKDEALTTIPSLLLMNDGHFYAYNDILIEYLLDNVITHNEWIPKNIKNVQENLFDRSNIMQMMDRRIINDQWQKDMRELLFDSITTKIDNIQPVKDHLGRLQAYTYTEDFYPQICDCNGYVDNKLEKFLHRGVI